MSFSSLSQESAFPGLVTSIHLSHQGAITLCNRANDVVRMSLVSMIGGN